jgi:class 3 adenylate cyclase/tetratricopeptide (TPR) repeat protein
MVQKRQLAAIMFTDIEGYTAFMQRDEAQAILLREEHRKIFNFTTEKYGGKILQYYGDGTLSIFDSAIAAVECGIEMQLSFLKGYNPIVGKTNIPVRIGIHSGDIIYSEEDIIGDSVNVASRIESLAAVGSVFISDKIFDEIKNQDSIKTQSMGWFELKNVVKSVEVFAISNNGLVVPDPNQIQGKAQKIKKQDDFFKTLWNRIQPQLVAGYFAGVWGIIQFTDWILNRYQISPFWTDIMLVFFLSLIPSLILYIWKRDRINQGKMNLLEKFAFPGNLTASILLLLILFKGTDLGSTTKTVSFNNENGIRQFRTIIKPDFRKKLAIHNFTPEKEDSIHQWMSWGIHGGVADDISQNGYLTLGFWRKTESLHEMIKLAKEDFYPYMLTGSYTMNGDNYEITSKLYNTQNGALHKTHTYRSKDFFALIDTISMVTKKDLGFNQNQINQFVDLPFEQAFTSSIMAYENYSLFFRASNLKYLEQAIALDSTFAHANHVMASFLYGHSFSLLGAKEAINQGMRFRKRLPESFESNLKVTYFQINNQPDKAIALLKMQLEMNPGDQNIIRTLTNYLYLTARYEELLTWREKLATFDPNPNNQFDVAEALLLNGRFEEAGQIILKIFNQYPNLQDAETGLAKYYALTGKIDKAESLLQKLIIKDPEIEPLAKHYFKAFQYAKDNPQTPKSLIKYKGHYRLQDHAAEFDIYIIENLLYVKGRTQMGGSFFIPSGPDEFMIAKENKLERWKFISDTSGQVYKIDDQAIDRNQQIFNYVLWRQDSLIRKAMALFSLEEKVKSLAAFRIAYEKNPRHFYLAEYIKHLEFVLDPSNKSALENIKNYVGRYGPRHIWIENDKIYYEREGQVIKQRLLPIAPNLFYFWGGFEYYMQVVVKKGKVKGTISWKYNDAIGEFVRDDNDYIEFDKLEY